MTSTTSRSRSIRAEILTVLRFTNMFTCTSKTTCPTHHSGLTKDSLSSTRRCNSPVATSSSACRTTITFSLCARQKCCRWKHSFRSALTRHTTMNLIRPGSFMESRGPSCITWCSAIARDRISSSDFFNVSPVAMMRQRRSKGLTERLSMWSSKSCNRTCGAGTWRRNGLRVLLILKLTVLTRPRNGQRWLTAKRTTTSAIYRSTWAATP